MELFMCNHPYFDKQFLAKNFAAVELDLKAQVKRRSSHAPNLIAALSSTQERRLT